MNADRPGPNPESSPHRSQPSADATREAGALTGNLAVLWNVGARRIKAYTADEIIGKHFSIFYPAADIAAGKPAFELDVAQAEGRFEEEWWRLRRPLTARAWASRSAVISRWG